MNTDMNIIMSMREAKEEQIKRRDANMKRIQKGQTPLPPGTGPVKDNEHGYLRPL